MDLTRIEMKAELAASHAELFLKNSAKELG